MAAGGIERLRRSEVPFLFGLLLLLAGGGGLAAQEFAFAGVGLATDLDSLAAALPDSRRSGGLIRVHPGESTNHISTIEVGPTRVRIGFELRDEAGRPVYPACTIPERTIEARHGPASSIREFNEEAMERSDRLWRSDREVMTLVCFRDRNGLLLAEAILIHPRGSALPQFSPFRSKLARSSANRAGDPTKRPSGKNRYWAMSR